MIKTSTARNKIPVILKKDFITEILRMTDKDKPLERHWSIFDFSGPF